MSKNKFDENNTSDDNIAISYEASFRYLIEKSNKRAWLIAFISVIIAFISVLALLLLTPLKQSIPYVIKVDNQTGMVDIVTSLKEEDISQNEALDKYFVSKYIKIREGYFFDMLQSDYELTQIYSSPEVSKDYTTIYVGKNARHEQLKDMYKVEIEILSVVLNDSAGTKIATVRFNEKTKRIIKTDGSSDNGIKTKVATLAYSYDTTMQMSEDERIKNPLGFKVTTYRIDDEIRR